MKQLSGICKPLFAMLLSFLAACASTNFDVVQEASFAIPASDNTRLGKHTSDWARSHSSGESAFFPLTGGSESLGARLRLIDAAEK
ncbi:MAG: hypothetical protein ACR2PH_02265, partial [Desulfobulbia bacterium]